MKPHVLGLDLSLTCSGWAQLEHHDDWRFSAGSIKTTPKKFPTMVARLAYIVREVRFFLDQGPTLVAIEAPTMGVHRTQNGRPIRGQANERAALNLMVQTAAADLEVPCVMVEPKRLKKFCTGGGGAKKEDMAAMVLRRWGFAGANDDEVDAASAAALAASVVGWVELVHPYEMDLVRKLKERIA